MGKKNKFPPGTWVDRELFESEAFISLTGVAPQLLILILSKRRIENHGRKGKEKKVCVNCDSIYFTYIEAKKKYRISKPRFTRAIDDLLEKGFINIKHQGGNYKQDKTIYALSDTWLIWKPGMVFEQRKIDPVKRGYRKPKTKVTHETVPIHTHENVPIRGNLG